MLPGEGRQALRRLVLIAITVLASACHGPVSPPPLAAWTELTGGDGAEIRAVTDSAACPDLMVDGKRAPMAERAAPDAAFPVRSCVLPVARGAKVSLNGASLPSLPAHLGRIVLFGDTGCRLKGDQIQLCNDPKAWPFADVARQAAAKHPDLVIHVGDYHYRETPCPAGVAGCAGTPSGDDWAVWNADFFEPAAPLLAAAPWVVIRGNHEACARAGKGWFRLLDPHPTEPGCSDATAPYAVQLDALTLAVLDSAVSADFKAPPELAAPFAQAFNTEAAAISGPFWLLTHRPVWALAPPVGKNAKPGALVPLNSTEQAAIDEQIPANLDMVVSGHVHTFATYEFGETRPAQLVVGVGGALYDQMQLAAGSRVAIDGKDAAAFALTDYGYLVMDRTTAGWDGALYRAGGDTVLATCRFAGRAISCNAPP